MPELAAPQLDALSGDLDRIAGQLAARQDARRRRASEAANAANDSSVASLEIQEGTEKRITEEKRKQSGFVSLAELADRGMLAALESNRTAPTGAAQAMQQVRPAGDMANNMASRDQISAMQQQLNTMTALLDLARGAGIRIATQAGGVSLPPASVQFGGEPS
jgi:hypothetical protein